MKNAQVYYQADRRRDEGGYQGISFGEDFGYDSQGKRACKHDGR